MNYTTNGTEDLSHLMPNSSLSFNSIFETIERINYCSGYILIGKVSSRYLNFGYYFDNCVKYGIINAALNYCYK